ncbi:MAG: zinc ribbon domain-containing protein [Candidatus Heimdallarchaeota archaeon]|nr:zinc ribbon domain-containing protein [Candidatus Heimdallarchaeota archaeon]MCK4877219.1 zinc ribbon domain-containing protein [Candidatus Heimdallarchaeota archaeon]
MTTNVNYVNKYSNYVTIGGILFIVSAIVNIIDKMLRGWSYSHVSLGYIIFLFTILGLFPIGWGIKELTDIYFVDHVTKVGKQTFKWMIIYASAVVLDIILLGWAMTAGFVGMAIIFGRVMGFSKLNKTFVKIKDLFNIKIGSVFYLIFAFYGVITTVFGGIANSVDDEVFQRVLYIFNGPIDSLIMITVGVKLIIDVFRIRKLILEKDIKPYSTKSSLFVKDRRKTPDVPTTAAHIQSTTQITRLQEEVEKRKKMVKKQEKKTLAKKTTEEIMENYVQCPKCNANTDKNIKYCTNCGKVFSKDFLKKKKADAIVQSQETKTESRTPTEVKRILSPKKEKIFQQIAIAIFLAAFLAYAFITANFTLIVYSWIIVAIFATYIIVNYIALFFAGRGFAITTALSDIAFMFVVLPIFIAIFTYFIFLGIARVIPMSLPVFRGTYISSVIVLVIIAVSLIVGYKLRSTNMSLKEYLQYRFDFKERAKELEKDKERVERKRSYFDNLDRVEAHMAKQRSEKVMEYEDFDYKQRLKDLGSPLEESEDTQDNATSE